MQTFLPYDAFRKSAKVLDDKRLGKQRVEVCQILRTLRETSFGWTNHPAVKMWESHELALAKYGLFICYEWVRRGFKDKQAKTILEIVKMTEEALWDIWVPMPSWLGDEKFHSSHRAVLLAKNFEHYSQFGWTEKPAVTVDGRWPYVWPVN